MSTFISKRAASSLDDVERGFEYLVSSKPAFLQSDSMTSSQKGTAMHTFMQYCDFNDAIKDVNLEIQKLTNKGLISESQAKSLDVDRLNILFGSEFCKTIITADNVYRELKLSSFVPVKYLEDTDFNDEVLVQGVADCVIEKNGELTLIDYKTDKVDSQEELMNRYVKQLSFYKNAVQKTLKKPVVRTVLYSFYLNKVCEYK